MPSDPLVLGFDTSAAHCAAALLSGDRILAARVEEMGRGQAERLMPLLEELLIEAGVSWRDLNAIGVGVGPGNFTGIRISVSAARGLALGLGIPAVGVSGFEARQTPGTLVAIPAPRDQVYVHPENTEPVLLSRDDAQNTAREAGLSLQSDFPTDNMVQAIARIAAQRFTQTPAAPAPLYVKPADAAPSRDVPPALIER
ncbi:MAG: tRNA (adenosine(37)-N6)-threonylcarbamoyltransferase complex dimerization subunit type 1 TsaB [Rhodobacteraceae bacterium]|nr:tRNA (adenosine(37)-N6)-threonylcarbamoyltransferase complex dimerization subunit type 1 TsaB [Paracoccaceae bacterium]